jgi:hypothetical protein
MESEGLLRRRTQRIFAWFLVPIALALATSPLAHADEDGYLYCLAGKTSLDDDSAVQLGKQMNRDLRSFEASGVGSPGVMLAEKYMRDYGLPVLEISTMVGCARAFLPSGSSGNAASGTTAEQKFLSAAAPYLNPRPPVTDQRLVELGYQACAVRRRGGSSDEAKSVLWRSLYDQGILTSQVVVGSLVYVAVNTFCPAVGYP